jgi:large subunit ribosomal protein L25
VLEEAKVENVMEATLQAEKRDGRGKNEARRLRASGRIPAIVYGTEKNKAFEISVDPKVLLRILHSEAGVNTLIGLQGAGLAGGGKVLVKEYQLDPIDHKLLHADFFAIAMDKMLTVTVPVVLKGEPKGVKQQGGIVDFVNREIEVECLPADIPEHVDIDISELMLHQGVRVRDLPQDGKWKAVSDADMMIVHVVPVKVEEAPAADAAAAATPGAAPAEPEVIKKGKKDEDDEKAEKKDKK